MEDPNESRPGPSMRKGVDPERLADMRRELEALNGDFPTAECIQPPELNAVSKKNFSVLMNPAERIRHFKACNLCQPLFRLALGLPKLR